MASPDEVQHWLDTIQQSAQARGLPYTYQPEPVAPAPPEKPGFVEGLAAKAPDLLGTNAGIIAGPEAAAPITALAARALPAPQAAQAISTATDPRYTEPFGPPATLADPNEIAAAQARDAAGAPQQQPAPPPPDANGVIPPATYVPAHFDPARVPVTPQTQADILGTYDAQADAQKNMAMSQALQARVTADQMAQEAERQNQSIANQKAKDDERASFVRSHLAKLDDLSQQFSQQTVDPQQWWDSRNIFQKAMAGIAITLGGGPAAVNGGHNVGLDMVNNAIQQSIDAQKTNLDIKRVGLTQQSNVLEQYRAAFGDERLGELALEHSLRENAIAKMQADAMGSQSPQIIEAAKNGIAQLDRQQDLTKAQFEQLAYVKAHMIGGPGQLQKTDQSLLVKVPGTGETVQAPTKEEAIEARKRAGAAQNITDIINRALAIRREAKLGNLTDSYQELEALQENYKLQAALFNSGGNRMNASDVDAMNKAAGAFTGVIGNNDAVMEHARDRIKQQFINELRAMGSEQVQRGYRVTPQGIEPGIAYKGQSDTPRGGGTGATSSFKPAGQ